ncbi:SET domain-containing protein [Lindgomyces ingoldianus]|uniref:SET domain-containing protein n=1 Tax=Lindgomyces ingoldianus TaxID=673940 RepID=A0ACB6R7N7_9PLEO|nr:SET domain-containing protein [Lindgomyces ingoldianus]KAF2475065.1 SET domain-containing protein [Lindgomyces ingoldianus]
MASQIERNTIYLTEEEAERIRNTVKNRLKKCSELVGHAREPRDLKAAISRATGASLMADMGGAPDPEMTRTKGWGGTLPVVAVGQPYPPCIIALQDLQPVTLGDLQMETHHRGRRLTVKRASPVVTLAARSWTMVKDEVGDEMERLEVCLHKSRHDEDVLESASVFVIKEPYFTLTDQGEATIRIDHPSDLIVCRDEIIANTAEKVASTCKDRGNAALKQQDLWLAHAKYTEGLKVARQEIVSNTNPDLARDISRNRAHVNLILNQLDEAKTDAKASLTGRQDQRSKDLDSKAYFRAGCAAYNLGEYQEAKGFFEEQQKLTPGDKDASTNLRKIRMRLHEQETGIYDWEKIRDGLSRARPRVDAASFINNTNVRDSPGRGRGLFASRDIPAEGIIMCEKAFCVVWGHESEALTAMTYDLRDDRIRVSPVGLSKSTVQKLLSNSSQIERVMDLYGDYQGDGKNVSWTEDGPVVDTFRVHDIISRNTFGPGSQYGEEGATNASTGLWIWSAYINHSCIANAKKECIGDLMVLRAIRPIAAGEEIFHSYDESSDYDARQTALMNTWGFQCNCTRCDAEKADDPAVRKKRRELVSEADAFVKRENWANAKRLTIAKAQRLARAINDTYDSERYKGVPRVAIQRIQEWLAKASPHFSSA